MSLAFELLFGYRFRNWAGYALERAFAEHKARYVVLVAKCVQASAELHAFFRCGLASAVPLVIMGHVPQESTTLFIEIHLQVCC